MSGTRSRSRRAPATELPALLLVGHGSSHPGAGAALDAHADTLRRSRRFCDVAVGWLRGVPTPEQALQEMSARRIVVAPMLMCDGFLVRRELPSRLAAAGRDIRFCAPLGVAQQLAPVLRRRALIACDAAGITAGAASVLLVGHGSPVAPASAAATRVQADRLAALGPFRSVSAAFLEQEPTLADALAQAEEPTVVLGFFASAGRHASLDVPRAIARLGTTGPVLYVGAIGDDPAVPDIVLDQAAAVTADCWMALAV